jgi:FKBP-type peptidyl-prolyl cis-trans isomerase
MVPGFGQGIGGAPGTAPMKVGGRRIVMLPAALGYGRTGTQDRSVPPNAPIVFVVDLVAVG